MPQFSPVYGTVLSIEPIESSGYKNGCALAFTLMTQEMGPILLTVTAGTFAADQETIKPGDAIAAFYDRTAPMPLIYPPRYTAILIAEVDDKDLVSFDYYGENLTNTDGTLKLNLENPEQTRIRTTNGQFFYGNPANHYLFVIYSATTRSIPAITVPEKVTVFCPAVP